jgi:hypothetical protein
MKRSVLFFCAIATIVLPFTRPAVADPVADEIPVGYVIYDYGVNGPNTAEFDIVNGTGIDNFDPTDFPISTALFTNLSLVVDYSNGKTATFGSSYFTIDAFDNLSFNGSPLDTLLGAPGGLLGATSATLTGSLNTKSFTFMDGLTFTGNPNFSATILDPSGLQDGDFALIQAAATPEPNALILAATGMLGLLLLRRRPVAIFAAAGSSRLGRGKSATAALAIGAALLLASASAGNAQSVTLAVTASPSSGASGTSAVSVTGSGFPSGTIPAASAKLTLASACGVSGATAPAILVTKIIGTSERVQFVIPAALASGTYYISISGTTSTGTAFASTNCAEVSVVGASPIASLSVPSITFPSLTAGSSSATQTVNLSNPGSSALTISSIGVTGTGVGFFPESNNCGSSIASGGFCTITVGFNPLTPTSYTAAITITDNASPTTQTVALGGTATPAFLSGTVYGGQLPINGATVTLWSAGTTGTYGSGATSIATATTNAAGSFSFSNGGASLCTTGQSLYVTSVGGGSGTSTNQYAALMAALPAPCSAATAGTVLVVNEVTTVASVTALQQFMSIAPGGSPAWSIGAPSANAIGLANAFLQVGNLVSFAGASAATTATNTINSVSYTTTITPDSNKINALADILAACVGTAGSGTCTSLLADTTPLNTAAPTDTLQAAYYLASNAGGLSMPAHGAAQGEPYYLCSTYASAASPFQPYSSCTAASYPTDWAIGVSWNTSNGTAVVGTATPYSLAIDGLGNIWTAYSCGAASNNCTDTANDTHNGPAYVTEFNPQGQVQFTPVSSTKMTTGPGLTAAITGANYPLLAGAPFSLAIDTANNAWFDSYWGSNPLTPATIGGVIAKIAPGGASTGYVIAASVPGAISIDGSNNLWLDDAPSYNAGNRYYLSELEYKSGAYSIFDVGLGRQTVAFSGVWVDSIGDGWSAPSTAAKCGSPTGTIYRATTTEMESTSTTSADDITNVAVCPVWTGAPDPTGGSFYANGGLYHLAISGGTASKTAPVMVTEAAGTGTTNGGLDNGAGTVLDGFGNVWVANGAGGVSEFSYSGTSFTPLSPAGTATVPVYGFGTSYLKGTNPINIATDASGNVWVGTQTTSLWYLVGIAGPTVTPTSQMLKTSFIGSRPGALTLDSLSPALIYNSVVSTGQALTTTLTNTGSAVVRISGITIGGTNPGDFSVTSTTCGATLAINTSCTITATFNSSSPGTFLGTLNVASNAAGSPASVNLTGTASASAGTIDLQSGVIPPAGSTVTFPTQVAGSVSTAQAVVLTNTGSTTMSLALATTGAGANLFPNTTNCGSSLAAGASCFVSFKFAPKVPASYAASLSITNDAGTGQAAALAGTATPFTITMNSANPIAWVIDNGAITFNWNSVTGNLNSWVLDGYSDQLVDTTVLGSFTYNGVAMSQPEGLYSGHVGPFMGGTPTASCTMVGATVVGAPTTTCTAGTGSTPYLDWAITWLDTASATNAYTFVWHNVVFPNDPGVHTYVQLVHNANDIAGGVGQIQWIFRDNQSIFTHTYEVNSSLGWLGVEDIPLPSVADMASADPGRTVQNAAEDLHGFTDLPAGFGREFMTKYDYAGYEYLHLASGLYGPAASGTTYGVWTVLPNKETFVGGPTKQDLFFTENIDMIEAYSDHEDEPMNLNATAGSVSNRLFGPYYIHVNTLGQAYNQTGNTLATQADMYADAISADAGLLSRYDSDGSLVAAGYVPSTGRGSVSIQMNGVAGPARTAWAVLSDPNTNYQVSCNGMQYWADISQNGSATITGVAPGTYRLSVYVLGQWGEYRLDGIVVSANNTTTVPVATFVPENFSGNTGGTSGETIFTIGTADRSSHEFLHGHNTATGNDDREYWGNWNFWKDFTANQGAVVYYATAVGSTPATNDLSKWNYTHWGSSFNPGLYAGVFNIADDTTDGYSQYPGQLYPGINGVGAEYAIPTYVASLPGSSGTNGAGTGTPAWQVYFATPADIASYGSGYVQLSISAACAYGSYVVNLNGTGSTHELVWHYTNASDCAIRSGLSGYSQWFVLEFPASYLVQTPGASNELTIGMSQSNGSEDDALRMELTNKTSNPAVTGWNDYTYIYGPGTNQVTPNNDAIGNPSPNP